MNEGIEMRRSLSAAHALAVISLALLGADACSSERADRADAAPMSACEGFTAAGASSYRVIEEPLDWNDAVARCETYPGAHLATFETAEEAAEVVAAIDLPSPVWTAVEQTVTPASGFDVDDGWFNEIGLQYTEIPAGFPWAPGEPSDGVQPKAETGLEDCAELHADGMFYDAVRGAPNLALCECALQ